MRVVFFFFSSRRRHTRFDCDWSSDVCSSDLVLAVVSDLFFVSRIRETGRLTGVAVEFARTTAEVEAALARGPRFALVDLTAGFDYDRILETAEVARVPVLGFTTHARARETQPWHARCRRVVTKETLTQELAALLQGGIGS